MIVKLQDDADDEKQASQHDSLPAGISFTDAGPTENISPATPVCNGQPDLEPSGPAIYQLADELGDGSAPQFALRWVLKSKVGWLSSRRPWLEETQPLPFPGLLPPVAAASFSRAVPESWRNLQSAGLRTASTGQWAFRNTFSVTDPSVRWGQSRANRGFPSRSAPTLSDSPQNGW